MTSAKSRYEALALEREPFLRRAFRAANLTIPSIMPEPTESRFRHRASQQELPTPYQSIGARGVTHLASKLLLSQLSEHFFRLEDIAGGPIERIPDEQIQKEVAESLANLERMIMEEVDVLNIRVPAHEGYIHLLITGNALQHLPLEEEAKGMRLFPLDTYVLVRDPMDNPFEIITREVVHISMLTEKQREALPRTNRAPKEGVTHDEDDFIELHTWHQRERNGKKVIWNSRQELDDGIFVEGSVRTLPEDEFPYMPLRLRTVAGQSYGRGIVEEYQGSLQSLEALSMSIVQGAALSARVLFLLNPDGLTREKDLATKPNGGFARGRRQDVESLGVDKSADLSVAANTVAALTDMLSTAFLLNSSVQRNAERVTAEEIRFVAQELEDSFGGAYTILAQEFQLPLVKLIMARLKKQGRMEGLDPKVVKPSVVTGISALSRGHELNRLQFALRLLAETLGPQAVDTYVDGTAIASQVFVGAGVPTEGLLRSREQIAERQQSQQLQSLTETLGPKALDKLAPDRQEETA